MAGHDPLSSRVGNVLSQVVGTQLNAKFHREADGATLPGHFVLVKGLPRLQCKGVFFLNLIPWDNNQDGAAVQVKCAFLCCYICMCYILKSQEILTNPCIFQVLRQGIRKILATCKINGFTSVALPVIGTGSVLNFPHNVAAKVLLEEVRVFEQSQASNTSFLLRIVIYPGDKKSSKVK